MHQVIYLSYNYGIQNKVYIILQQLVIISKSSILYCIVLYLFPKIPYTGMYPMDVGIVNKLAH